jgi:hypothetical protein
MSRVWVRANNRERCGFACNGKDESGCCPCGAEFVLIEESAIKKPFRAVYDCLCESCLEKKAPDCFKVLKEGE